MQGVTLRNYLSSTIQIHMYVCDLNYYCNHDRAINNWNRSLLQAIVDSPSINEFKLLLDSYYQSGYYRNHLFHFVYSFNTNAWFINFFAYLYDFMYNNIHIYVLITTAQFWNHSCHGCFSYYL